MKRLAMAVAVVLVAAIPTTVGAYDLPETAVREYLDGVAQADMDRVLEATAVDEMTAGYHFERMVERLNSYQPAMSGPVHSAFFADAERLDWMAEAARAARTLAYTLLVPEELGDVYIEMTPVYDVGTPWATDLMDELDESRLSGLNVVDIGLPAPEYYAMDINLERMATQAGVYGADEMTERVVLIEFEDETYAIGFELFRYGDDWKVKSQTSPLGGLPPGGAAEPMSRPEFEALISE